MFVYVGGIPGVGKTTIIKRSIELAKREDFSIQGLGEKKLLCQIVGVNLTEKYAKLLPEIRARARKQLVEIFYNVDTQDPVTIRIRDDHFTVPNEDGTYWIRPFNQRDKLHMLAFVVIIAEPNMILQRRLAREFLSSEPNFLNLNEISRHQEMEMKIASSQAECLGISFKIVENEEEKIEQASEAFLSFVKEIIRKRRLK